METDKRKFIQYALKLGLPRNVLRFLDYSLLYDVAIMEFIEDFADAEQIGRGGFHTVYKVGSNQVLRFPNYGPKDKYDDVKTSMRAFALQYKLYTYYPQHIANPIRFYVISHRHEEHGGVLYSGAQLMEKLEMYTRKNWQECPALHPPAAESALADRFAYLMLQMCSKMLHLNMYHGDLNPGNIGMSKKGAVMLDFDDETCVDSVPVFKCRDSTFGRNGTPQFMAPESLFNDNLNDYFTMDEDMIERGISHAQFMKGLANSTFGIRAGVLGNGKTVNNPFLNIPLNRAGCAKVSDFYNIPEVSDMCDPLSMHHCREAAIIFPFVMAMLFCMKASGEVMHLFSIKMGSFLAKCLHFLPEHRPNQAELLDFLQSFDPFGDEKPAGRPPRVVRRATVPKKHTPPSKRRVTPAASQKRKQALKNALRVSKI